MTTSARLWLWRVAVQLSRLARDCERHGETREAGELRARAKRNVDMIERDTEQRAIDKGVA